MVGSGPSIEMGYPSWEKLAAFALELATTEQRGYDLTSIHKAMEKKDYPLVFQEVRNVVGGPRLLQRLREKNKPSRAGRIYELIAQWPVPVYLTTNYDDELQNHLANLGMSYHPYSNTEDHFSLLIPGVSDAIVKLHGDLRSEEGLILTREQYKEISNGANWKFWRTKLTSIFQMSRIVVIGHSLSDTNIRHVLEAAKLGTGVVQPVCWIAPDVSSKDCKEFLEKYRIRVIPYDNRDGEHKNLLKLIENINEFVPARTVVTIQKQIEKVSSSPLGPNAAAPGFFVFNKFLEKADYDEKRIEIVISAIQSVLPELNESGEFTLKDALVMSGWPKELPLDQQFAGQIRKQLIEEELLMPVGKKFTVSEKGMKLALENRKRFNHMRDRFKDSLLLRLKRDYSSLNDAQSSLVSSDIEASLTGFFREGGLSLASTLFSGKHYGDVPSSVVPFISLSAARYDDLLMRQAFFTESVDVFTHPQTVDKEYLGRISQGFFAFHALGVFGDVAIERLRHAKETVWLVDSSAQIRALALAAPTNELYTFCFVRLHGIGLRFFTTEGLFDETREHLWFADNVIKENGPDSPLIIAAAKGEPPYSKQNEFLVGFIRWQAAGNPRDWQGYLYHVFGSRQYNEEAIKNALKNVGIEIIGLKDWPGFSEKDYGEAEQYVERIVGAWEDTLRPWISSLSDQLTDPYKKAKPEAEALIIVKNERAGVYHAISDEGQESSSWFLSSTSMLNIVEEQARITWQPEAFMRFSSTLCEATDSESAEQSFEALLLGLAQSGVNLLDEDIIARVFGSTIDQAKLSIDELHEAYHDTLEQKYGESPESVVARLAPSYQPLAVIQLASEVAEAASRREKVAVEIEREATKRAEVAEKKLERVRKYRLKMEAKKQRLERRTKKLKASQKKRKK